MLSYTELVGLDTAKQALLLLAVNPRLKGVAMHAGVGSGKSSLTRGFAALLPSGTPFVEMPLNVTDDRLLGGLDLEATFNAGRRVIERGLLARADGGVLYCDGVNLLDSSVVAQLSDALTTGSVRLERDGSSAVHAAMFTLIATYDASDGDAPRGLLDRVGLVAACPANGDAGFRAEVVRRNLQARSDSDELLAEAGMLSEIIVAARALLPRVQIRDEQIEALAQTAVSLGVEGNRADVYAVEAALASAALGSRFDVDDDDLKLATRLVLVPRATRVPETDEPAPREPAPAPPDPPQQSTTRDDSEPAPPPAAEAEQLEELLLSAAEVELSVSVLNMPFATQRRGKSGGRGAALNRRRGKPVAAIPGAPRDNRIALLPTLLAAAPWQKLRRVAGPAETPQRAHTARGGPLRIESSDIRVKRYRDKAGTLYVFVVDASGSMAINRMREAKGAAVKLLQSAYVHRDQVALISFRGREAKLLMPPSQSVERAKRELDVLPVGGGTPLASALLSGWQTALLARQRGTTNITLVILTDGRANIGLRQEAAPRVELEAEVQALAARILGDGITAIVIDTQASYLSTGEAPKLARWLGGQYVYLPNAKSGQIVNTLGGRAA